MNDTSANAEVLAVLDRSAAPARPEFKADLWDTVAAERLGVNTWPLEPSSPGAPDSRGWWRLGIAAVAAAGVVGAVVWISQPSGTIVPIDVTIAPTPATTVPASVTAVSSTTAPTSTSAPENTSPTTVAAVATSTPPSTAPAAAEDRLSVSYLDPPPVYEPHVIATLPSVTYSVALGDGFVVAGVSGDAATVSGNRMTVLDLATSSATTLVVERLPRGLLAGPGHVVYGEIFVVQPGQQLADQRFVAIALEGDRAGQVILDVPSLGHPLDPIGDNFYDHGAAGVIDTLNGDALMTGFLDPAGRPFTPQQRGWPLVRYDFENDVMTHADGPTWRLSVDAHPQHALSAISHVGAGAGGTAVFATWLGPAIGGDSDAREYLPPTQPVIAALMPDGTGTWHRLPEGWWVADSNVWGTLLMSQVGNSTQLAWFDPTTTPGGSSAPSPP
jgi:hypothetical protein